MARRTNLVPYSEDFSQWSVAGTPVRTSGQADPLGGTAAYLIGDDDGAGTEGVFAPVTFTGNGEKCASIFLKAGTATATRLVLFDSTASNNRHRVNVAWSGGMPTLTTVTGGGTLFTPIARPGGFYRILFSATGIVAANTNRLYLYPAGETAATTGNVIAFGGQAEDAAIPSDYIRTTGAARSVGDDARYLRDLTEIHGIVG